MPDKLQYVHLSSFEWNCQTDLVIKKDGPVKYRTPCNPTCLTKFVKVYWYRLQMECKMTCQWDCSHLTVRDDLNHTSIWHFRCFANPQRLCKTVSKWHQQCYITKHTEPCDSKMQHVNSQNTGYNTIITVNSKTVKGVASSTQNLRYSNANPNPNHWPFVQKQCPLDNLNVFVSQCQTFQLLNLQY